MIKSKFISEILDLLLDGDTLGNTVREQINYLTDIHYEYTSSGVFVKFSHLEGIQRFRADIEKLILNGVIITSKQIDLEAEAMIFCENGLIDILEIWCYRGEYPKGEPATYTLTQEWTGSPGRKVVVE